MRQLRRLLHVLLELVLLLMLVVAAVAWRLTYGPLDVTLLTTLYEQHSTPRITVGHAALVWEGFQGGVDQPLELRVDDMRAVGRDGSTVAEIPHATVSVSLTGLLFGRIIWRAVELDQTSLRLLRESDGSTRLDPGEGTPGDAPSSAPRQDDAAKPAPRDGDAASSPDKNPFAGLLDALRRPPGHDDTSRFGELSRLVIRGGTMTVIDRQLGLRWEATDVGLDLRRRPQGGVQGNGSLALTAGIQTARLTLVASLGADETDGPATPRREATTVRLTMTPVSPARLSGFGGPASAALAALDAPIGFSLDATLDRRLAPTHAAITLTADAGAVTLNGTRIPLEGASASLTATPQAVSLDEGRIRLGQAGKGPAPTLVLKGRAERQESARSEAWKANVSIGIDRLAIGDLPAYWPPGLAANARTWLVSNLTDGLAHDGHLDATLEGSAGAARITGLSGGLDADDVAVHWLRPVPAAEAAHVHVTLIDPDALEITTTGGHQGALAIPQASMRITGLSQKDQFSTIALDVAGNVPDTLAFLAHPRLNLLSKRPLSFTEPAGTLTAHVGIDLPLDNDVTIEQIAIRVHARLAGLHLGNVAAGRALDQGRATLDVTNDGLTASGEAVLAHVPARLSFSEDFRDGPPGQVIESADAAGMVSPAALAANGLPSGPLDGGTASVTLGYREQRRGEARFTIDADLAQARVVSPLGWSKAAGAPGHLAATLLLTHGKLTGIEGVSAEAPGLVVRSHVDVEDDRPVALHLDRFDVGRTSATGVIRLPSEPSGAWGAELSGPMLDLSPLLAAGKTARGDKRDAGPADAKAGPPYTLSLHFGSVLMAGGVSFADASLQAASDGRHVQSASLRAGGAATVDATIAPLGAGRRVNLQTSDVGMVLRGLDVAGDVQGGALTLEGAFDDRQAGSPLDATVTAQTFRVTNAPLVGRILQGMTLYGLVDALRGPGLRFDRLVMPFRYERQVLTLKDARAFSPSLGLTAKGPIDFGQHRIGVTGTIVPAYFFNTLLGRVPLVGRLFSPETGGGVFAATFRLSGAIDDPTVSVNPLAALTPGALRGLFGLLP